MFKGKQLLKVKAILSLLLFLFLLLNIITGLILFFQPRGGSHGGSDTLIDRSTLVLFHDYGGIVFSILMTVHFLLNWKIWLAELHNFAKKTLHTTESDKK
jgi:hypothetical protein